MLKDKTVIVTGAAKGIGRAIALKFADEGANIVVNYRSSVSEQLIEEIESKGVKCLAFKADVSKFDEALALVNATVKEFNSVDVLVNNAGITKDTLIMRMSEEDFSEVIDINLKGTFNMIRHTIKIMLKQKSGTIVNMSSVIGIVGNTGQVNYAASKAGVIGITKSVAKEVASRGITCNAIAPGLIQTDMTDILSEKSKEAILNNVPLKRFGKPEEVAQLAVFLANNRYITGQVINIDGGMVMN